MRLLLEGGELTEKAHERIFCVDGYILYLVWVYSSACTQLSKFITLDIKNI